MVRDLKLLDARNAWLIELGGPTMPLGRGVSWTELFPFSVPGSGDGRGQCFGRHTAKLAVRPACDLGSVECRGLTGASTETGLRTLFGVDPPCLQGSWASD